MVWLGLDFPLPALACSSIANSSSIIQYTTRVLDNSDGKAITILLEQKKKRVVRAKEKEKERKRKRKRIDLDRSALYKMYNVGYISTTCTSSNLR